MLLQSFLSEASASSFVHTTTRRSTATDDTQGEPPDDMNCVAPTYPAFASASKPGTEQT